MPQFEIDSSDRIRAQRLVEFVSKEFLDMRTEAKFVFAIELLRVIKPELDELKRREKEQAAPAQNLSDPSAPCQKELMAAGVAYPRTCAACGLWGPCRRGYSPQWTPANPVGNGPPVATKACP